MSNYKAWLEAEGKALTQIREKLEKAREEGNTAAIQVFEALETSSLKAMDDLRRLIRVSEVRQRKQRRRCRA